MAGKLEERVRDIIVEQLGVNAEQVTPEASFIDDLGADSLDSVELIMAFEEVALIGSSTFSGCLSESAVYSSKGGI